MLDDFDFPIVNFLYLCSNIPESPAYGVLVSQSIQYARVCSKYDDFVFGDSILVSKLLRQGYFYWKLLTTFRKLYGGLLSSYSQVEHEDVLITGFHNLRYLPPDILWRHSHTTLYSPLQH